MKMIRVNLYNNNICLSNINDSIIGIDPKENFKELNDFKNFLRDGIKEDTFKYIIYFNSIKNFNNDSNNSKNYLKDDSLLRNNNICLQKIKIVY